MSTLRFFLFVFALLAMSYAEANVGVGSGNQAHSDSTSISHSPVGIIQTPPGLYEHDGQQHPPPIAALYMVAPNVLCIELDDLMVHSFSESLDWHDKGVNEVIGDDGQTWENGPWRLTRSDGRLVDVTGTARDSRPNGSPYAEYGWGKDERSHLVDMRHAIYLTLAEPLGNQEALTIAGPLGLNYKWEFDYRLVTTPVIQLNQVGYSPNTERRHAYVSWWLGSGGPMSLNDFPAEAEVAQSKVKLSDRVGTEDLGVPIKEIDLTDAPIDTPFRIRIPGVGVSYLTEVSDQSVMRSFYVVTRGLFHNRFGRNTQSQFTNWVRPRDLQRPIWTSDEPDYSKKFPESTPKRGKRKVEGGHHDAGDFDIRPMHYQVAMLLMEAYELQPEAFTDDQLNIPESGNGVPDLLDEALYSLKAWEDLQEADGGVRQGIEATRHPWNVVFADEDPLDYWTYARETKHTLRVAGLFAQAGRLLSPYDAVHAEQLVERARRAYIYAVGHGASDQDFGRMLYATGELWRATGEDQYKERFERVWRANVKWGKYPSIYPSLLWQSAFGKASEIIIGEYVLGYLTSPDADPLILRQARRRISELATQAIAGVERQGHRNGRDPGTKPSWGHDTAALRPLLSCVWLLRLNIDEQKCLDVISLARDYALGANPLSRVWFTGLGERSVHHPLHMDSRAFGLKDPDHPEQPASPPMPGIPVYGPIFQLKDSPAYNYAGRLTFPPLGQRPLLRRWADNSFWVSTNEFDVVHHAVQVLAMAALMSPGQTPPADWSPQQAQ